MSAQNVKADNVSQLDARPLEPLEASQWGGRVRCQMDVYEADGLEAGSTIEIARIPSGARVLPVSCIAADALGAGVTLAAGDETTADKYLAATVMNTAHLVTRFNAVDALGVKLAAQEAIRLTTGGAAATGTIRSFVFYTVD